VETGNVDVGGRLLRVDPLGLWWCSGEGSTMRRGGAGGLTARLMYACWFRSSAIRRKVPWTKYAY
jgi:hypothetical protein